jgi:pterin-4a-carbinolamine dehydratase
MSQQWKERTRPVRLERKYEFSDYESLRDFLERAADLSEKEDLYPDIGFGRDYVNMTIHLDEDHSSLKESQHRFAQQLDALHDVTEH